MLDGSYLISLFDLWNQLLEAGRSTAVYQSWQHSENFWRQTLLFLSLSLRGLGVALLIGIPIGVLLTRIPRIAAPIMAVLGLLQTIPSLALLGMLIPLLGFGAKAALFAAVVYSLFPIVLNTYVGIQQVAMPIRDAARGMGMTPAQILWKVELPLALPVLLVGVRTGAVYAIGIVTICAMVGAGGLGDYIVTGLSRGDDGLILLGVIPILIITLLLFWGLGAIAWFSRKSGKLGLALGGSLIVVLAGYAAAEPWLRARRADVVLGSKDFTEGRILTEIIRLLLQAHTDLRIEVVPNLGSKLAYKGLLAGEIDIYPEYTGNLLTGEDALARSAPANRSTITRLVREEMRQRFHVVLLETFGLNNTYALCVTRPIAEKYGLEKIGDLARVPEFRVVVDIDLLKRPDGWQGLVKTYGLNFHEPPTQVNPDFLYRGLQAKKADLVVGFATDWQIAALDLVVLKDDRAYFPNYHAAPLIRESVLRRHPEIESVLNRLHNRIDDETMRRLNFEVAQQRRSETDVAREFLQRQGLLTR
jgi:osmoprotectant transport system permease protein